MLEIANEANKLGEVGKGALVSLEPKWRRTRCTVSANLRRGVEQTPGDPLNFGRCNNKTKQKTIQG